MFWWGCLALIARIPIILICMSAITYWAAVAWFPNSLMKSEKNGAWLTVHPVLLYPMLKPGPFLVSLQTRNDQTTQALQVLNQTLADFIAKGPTEAELDCRKEKYYRRFCHAF